MRASSILFLALAAASLHAADPIPNASDSPAAVKPFKFPAPARTPSTPPAPIPGEVPKLAGDSIYVVPHDEAFVLVASPPGLVTITREAGPLKVRGKFLDGTASIETRTFAAKNIAVVEPVAGASGRVELIAVPVGATDEAKVERQLIDVNHGPQPPPDKEVIPAPKPLPPPVDPKPEPKPNPVAGDIHVILIEENDERTVATANFVNDLAFWKRMQGKQVYFHVYDKDEKAAIDKGFVAEANKVGLPAILVMNDGDVLKRIPRPKDTAAMEAVLKEVRP